MQPDLGKISLACHEGIIEFAGCDLVLEPVELKYRFGEVSQSIYFKPPKLDHMNLDSRD